MNLEKVSIKPFEDSWKDWFIIDTPKEKVKVTLLFDTTPHIFYVDSRFEKFKVTALSNKQLLPCFIAYYLFSEGESRQIQSIRVYPLINSILNCQTMEFVIGRSRE